MHYTHRCILSFTCSSNILYIKMVSIATDKIKILKTKLNEKQANLCEKFVVAVYKDQLVR